MATLQVKAETLPASLLDGQSAAACTVDRETANCVPKRSMAAMADAAPVLFEPQQPNRKEIGYV